MKIEYKNQFRVCAPCPDCAAIGCSQFYDLPADSAPVEVAVYCPVCKRNFSCSLQLGQDKAKHCQPPNPERCWGWQSETDPIERGRYETREEAVEGAKARAEANTMFSGGWYYIGPVEWFDPTDALDIDREDFGWAGEPVTEALNTLLAYTRDWAGKNAWTENGCFEEVKNTQRHEEFADFCEQWVRKWLRPMEWCVRRDGGQTERVWISSKQERDRAKAAQERLNQVRFQLRAYQCGRCKFSRLPNDGGFGLRCIVGEILITPDCSCSKFSPLPSNERSDAGGFQ